MWSHSIVRSHSIMQSQWSIRADQTIRYPSFSSLPSLQPMAMALVGSGKVTVYKTQYRMRRCSTLLWCFQLLCWWPTLWRLDMSLDTWWKGSKFLITGFRIQSLRICTFRWLRFWFSGLKSISFLPPNLHYMSAANLCHFSLDGREALFPFQIKGD